jgi:hypothetical protein
VVREITSFKDQAEPFSDHNLKSAFGNEHNPEPVVLVHDIFEHIEALWVNSSAVELVEQVRPDENVENDSIVFSLIRRVIIISTVR